MNRTRERIRVTALLLALLLFFARVVAQIQVLLLEPGWLPPMEAWYSGLLPYPVLLPAQILLLMLMAIVAGDHVRGRGFFWPVRNSVRLALRAFAAIYAAAMALRLGVLVSAPPHDLLASGVIPVVFHWVLAGFVALVAAAPMRSGHEAATFDPAPPGWDHELLERVYVNGREKILHVSARELVRLRRLLDA